MQTDDAVSCIPGCEYVIDGEPGRETITGEEMATARCQQKTVMSETPAITDDSRKMLRFDTGETTYSIDLSETIDVIRDLMMIQACNAKSATRHFIKFNRRHTIVFNLDQCLSFQEGLTSHRNASFVMLEEKIEDSCVGLLVPGVRSVITTEANAPRPVGSRKKTGRSWLGKKARNAASTINLRELVDNYLLHLKYIDSRSYLRN